MRIVKEDFKLTTKPECKPVIPSPIYKTTMYECDSNPPELETKRILSVEIGVEFYATNASLPIAEQQAVKTVMRRMYGDINALTHEIRFAAFNGDMGQVISLCEEIQKITN